VQSWLDEYPLVNNAVASSDVSVRSEVIKFVSNAANEADRSRGLREQPSTTRAKRTVAPPSGTVSQITRSGGAVGSDDEGQSAVSYQRPDWSAWVSGSAIGGAVVLEDERQSAASYRPSEELSRSSESGSSGWSVDSQRGSQGGATDEEPGSSSQGSSVISLVF
jgi:hypothetical protein